MQKDRRRSLLGHTPPSEDAWLQFVNECVSAEHRLSNRSGYPPLQRVFGTSHRLRGDLLPDDHSLTDTYRDVVVADQSFAEPRLLRGQHARPPQQLPSPPDSQKQLRLDGAGLNNHLEPMMWSWCGEFRFHVKAENGSGPESPFKGIMAQFGYR